MQFREIEFASGLKHQSLLNEFREDEFAQVPVQKRFEAPSLGDTFYAALRMRVWMHRQRRFQQRRGASEAYGKRAQAVLEILTHFEERNEEFQLAEALLEHD